MLDVKNLKTHFFTEEGVVRAVDGVTWHVDEGETLALVGESGCGKSVTAMSILRLIPSPPGRIVDGEIVFEGQNLLEASDEEMRAIRGNRISMVFQEPMTSLNPVLTIGQQIRESIILHLGLNEQEATQRSIELLELVGIPDAGSRITDYPHQFSGGMRQRVMIAMSMAWQPRMLIADEITSNLDVTLQADVLDRLRRLISEKQSSIVLITHDMGVIAQLAEFVAVMYAGSIVEYSSTIDLFNKPYHPYTDALLQTIPRLDQPDRNLQQIPGSPPDLIDLPDQCPYLSRCSKATNQCRLEPRPLLREIRPGHFVACYNELQ